MKLIPLTLLAYSLLLLSCEKEEGGVQFKAVTRRSYNYYGFTASLLNQRYGDVIKKVEAGDARETILISPMPDGKYYWSCFISYDSARVLSGNKTFGGDVVIEKGKLKEITIEVD